MTRKGTVCFVFTIGERFHLENEAKFMAIELFDRYKRMKPVAGILVTRDFSFN